MASELTWGGMDKTYDEMGRFVFVYSREPTCIHLMLLSV